MGKILFSIVVSLWLSGCSSGGGGSDPVVVEPTVYYAETVTIVNAYEPDEQNITRLYHSVADCMGYAAPEPPVVYVIDDLSTIWADVPDKARGFTRSVGGFVDIYALPEGLNSGTLSHEFVHYLMYRNNETSAYNTNHLSNYFNLCRQ